MRQADWDSHLKEKYGTNGGFKKLPSTSEDLEFLTQDFEEGVVDLEFYEKWYSQLSRPERKAITVIKPSKSRKGKEKLPVLLSIENTETQTRRRRPARPKRVVGDDLFDLNPGEPSKTKASKKVTRSSKVRKTAT